MIILSGRRGSRSITGQYARMRFKGTKRNELSIFDFKNVMDSLVTHFPLGVIFPHISPFLPMEENEVKNCIQAELQNDPTLLNRSSSLSYKEIVDNLAQDVLGHMKFIPAENPIMCESGCKKINTILKKIQ